MFTTVYKTERKLYKESLKRPKCKLNTYVGFRPLRFINRPSDTKDLTHSYDTRRPT